MKALNHILNLSYALMTAMTMDASHLFLMLDFLKIPCLSTHLDLDEIGPERIQVLPLLKKS